MTLDVEPAFGMRQDVYDGLPIARLTRCEEFRRRVQREPVHRLDWAIDEV